MDDDVTMKMQYGSITLKFLERRERLALTACEGNALKQPAVVVLSRTEVLHLYEQLKVQADQMRGMHEGAPCKMRRIVHLFR